MPIQPNLKRLNDFSDAGRALPQLEQNVSDAVARVAQQAAPLLVPTSQKTSAYTAKLDDLVVAAGTFTVTLPVASRTNAGRYVCVEVQSGTITVASASGRVQGAATDSLSTAGSYLYQSDGVGWWRMPIGAGGGGVSSVTAGAGLVNSGSAANPVIDAVSGAATLTITANNMEVAAAIVSGAALGATSVQSVTAADSTIVIAGTATNPTVAVGVISDVNVDDTIVTESVFDSDVKKLRKELQHIRLLMMTLVELEMAN